jgi:hypothetical protein
MSKKKADVMERERRIFIDGLVREDGTVEVEGCVRRGVPADVAAKIFEDMSSFASYAFNKSHAAAYAMVAYQTAYLKCRYPREYMAALLTSVVDGDKILRYIRECQRMGITILPPDVNKSVSGFASEGENIRFGLLAVKNLGHNLIADLVREAEQIAAEGQREIVITGINTGDFGRTTGEKFIDLLRALDAVEGIDRYRISSIEPNLLTDEIIEFCASSKKFQHHFHIPIQSGSNKILGLMRRRYTAEKFAERIAAVRRWMPDVFIGIDVIVGFPGEGEEEFAETYRLLSDLRPAFLHIFPFSERPGTPAVELPNKVQASVATRRAAELDALCKTLHHDFCAAAVGEEDEVLFESTMRGGMMFGFTGNYRRVRVPYDRSRINTICRVKMVGMDDSGDLIGEILE